MWGGALDGTGESARHAERSVCQVAQFCETVSRRDDSVEASDLAVRERGGRLLVVRMAAARDVGEGAQERGVEEGGHRAESIGSGGAGEFATLGERESIAEAAG